MRSLPFHLLSVGLLLAALSGAGCTPGSSKSPASPDTSSTTDTLAASTTAPTAEPSSTAPASTRTVSQRLRDASLTARIKQALARDRDLRAFNFFPKVARGDVTMRGDVDTHDQYREAERIVRAVDGVETLTNQITVEGHLVSDGENDSAASSTSDSVYHTVRRGDTLWGIAREYEVSVGQIEALNPRSVSSLQPGDRIRIR